MKVTVIPTIREFPWGAPGKCMGQLVAELLEGGHEVQWLVAPIDIGEKQVADLSARGAKIQQLPPPESGYVTLRRLRRRLDRLVGRSKSLVDAVGKFRPDHVFVNQGGTWCALDEPFDELLPKYVGRYSLLCHSTSDEGAFSGERLRKASDLARNAKRVFFNSRWLKGRAESQIRREIPNASYFQIAPGARFQLQDWPEISAVARLAMVTRLDCRVKGLDLAVQAMAIVNRGGLRAGLDIYGDGFDKEQLQQLVREAGDSAGVRLMGAVQDVSQIWRHHEMLLMPSRTEGLGLAMVEAMSCGRPVLRTPLGGCEEWIEDGVNGFVCPQADVKSLVDTLEKAVAMRNRWRGIGLAANAKIKAQLDPRPGRVFLEALLQ
jgi:glycosyltransferase involved in cell wall biosynthesis